MTENIAPRKGKWMAGVGKAAWAQEFKDTVGRDHATALQPGQYSKTLSQKTKTKYTEDLSNRFLKYMYSFNKISYTIIYEVQTWILI